MSRYMRQVTSSPPIWRAVVVYSNGHQGHFGPYEHKVGATQAALREVRRDERDNSVIRTPRGQDPWGPFDETPNPNWRPAIWWREKATQWERE